MAWFITKVYHRVHYLSQCRRLTDLQGGLVEEDKPVNLTYRQTQRTSYGRFDSIATKIFFSSDPLNSGAPKYVTDFKSHIDPNRTRHY